MTVADLSGANWSARTASTTCSAWSAAATSTSPTRWWPPGPGSSPPRTRAAPPAWPTAYARVSGRLTALTVHQGPGVTNALTGVTEAAKSRTPWWCWLRRRPPRARTSSSTCPAWPRRSVRPIRRVRAEHAVADVADAVTTATAGAGRTVLLGLPLDVQAQQAVESAFPGRGRQPWTRPRRT